ncbi:MAG: hypothetical protein P8K08_14425 [Fuerstiella sp.]|nr:hypothetical protein [Fuerstiella sp.]
MAMLVDVRRDNEGRGIVVAGHFAVVRFSYGAACSFTCQLRKTKDAAGSLVQKPRGFSNDATATGAARREIQGTVLISRKLQMATILRLFMVELSTLVVHTRRRRDFPVHVTGWSDRCCGHGIQLLIICH